MTLTSPIASWRRTRLLSAVGAIALLAACGAKPTEEGKPTGVTCPTTQTLTYENFGKSFMETYCLRCHSSKRSGEDRKGAPADHNFDTVAEIRPLAEHIDELAGSGPAATNTQMPENDPRPSVAERTKLAEWLACEAP